MAAQLLRAPAQPIHSRRRLADNVVCLYQEDRPPVEQIRGRRGRFPACVTQIHTVPRLRIGAICEIYRTAVEHNRGIVVRIFEITQEGDICVESVFGREIHYSTGNSGKKAVVNPAMLRRTVIGERHV